MIFFQFPAQYIETLVESLIHPPSYTPRFSSSCENASLWSICGEHHRGIALMFRTEEDSAGNTSLPLKGAVGVSSGGPIFRVSSHRLHRVDHSEGAARIDFFRYMGQLSYPRLLQSWWCDEYNNISPPRLSLPVSRRCSSCWFEKLDGCSFQWPQPRRRKMPTTTPQWVLRELDPRLCGISSAGPARRGRFRPAWARPRQRAGSGPPTLMGFLFWGVAVSMAGEGFR